MSFSPDKIRNVVILGHQGSGKTTLVESLYQVATDSPTKGSVEKGTTISDYLKEEQDRLSSIQGSIVPVEYEGYRYNFIDLPGNDDFVGEIIGVTSCVKGAILVIDATSGVQQGTIKHFKMLRKKNIPTIINVITNANPLILLSISSENVTFFSFFFCSILLSPCTIWF